MVRMPLEASCLTKVSGGCGSFSTTMKQLRKQIKHCYNIRGYPGYYIHSGGALVTILDALVTSGTETLLG